MAMPAVPGAGFVMIQPKLGLGHLKAFFDRPAMPLDRNQRLNRGAGGTPGRKVGHLAVTDAAPEQQAAGPEVGVARSPELSRLEISQFEKGPVIQPRSLGAVAGRKAPPGCGFKRARNVLGRATDKGFTAPRMDLMCQATRRIQPQATLKTQPPWSRYRPTCCGRRVGFDQP